MKANNNFTLVMALCLGLSVQGYGTEKVLEEGATFIPKTRMELNQLNDANNPIKKLDLSFMKKRDLVDFSFSPQLRESLRDLNLNFLWLSAEELENLGIGNLVHLERLNLARNRIREGNIGFLSGLTNLTTLCLYHNFIQDDSVVPLLGMKHLRELYLGTNFISDKGAGYISTITSLEILSLDDNGILNAGVASLTALKNLRKLTLWNNYLGNESAKFLSTMSLTELDLGRNHIGNAGLAFLKNMPHLRALYVHENNINDDGVESLKALKEKGLQHWFGNELSKEKEKELELFFADHPVS